MRIISGKYKGKKINGYNIQGTRPTMDRVKESLFGIIQGYVGGARVLDLFAGSGSLGLEAISNGASKLVMVDNNDMVIKTLQDNIKSFSDDISIIKMDYKKYLKTTDERFDIIFLDPPYRSGLMNKALKLIQDRQLLLPGGIVICEFQDIKIETNMEMIREKRYGEKTICIFRS